MVATVVRAEVPELLNKAAENWLGERDKWAFTLEVREFDGGKVKEERRERYDPSKPGTGRWELLLVDGKPPAEEKRADWQKRKTKKRKNPGKPMSEYLDLDRATIVQQTSQTVSYRVPLRSGNKWLFPIDKVHLRVTVNRETFGLEVVVASIDEPFRVWLGLAKVLDLDFDLQMNPSEQNDDASEPASSRPDGTANVVLNKLGERLEYEFSEFQRVTPHPDNVIAANTRGLPE
ncbi:MAG TPA: hypothetical protein VMM36_09210 [Opitutaceae bacterium]|nr:hypothetical protein [Opitutaceae bacterium]